MTIDKNSLEFLSKYAKNKFSVYFSCNSIDIVFETYLMQLKEDKVLLVNKVPPEYISTVIKANKYFLQCGMLRFISSSLQTDGKNIIFKIKDLEQLEETRKSERYIFTPDENVVCELLNPYDEKTILTKTVLDMSYEGLSIRSFGETKLFKPGTIFKQLRILIDGHPYKNTGGKVIYLRKLLDIQQKLRVQIGLKLQD